MDFGQSRQRGINQQKSYSMKEWTSSTRVFQRQIAQLQISFTIVGDPTHSETSSKA